MNPPDEAVREELAFLKLPETEKVKKWVPPKKPQKPQKRNQRLSFKCTMDERKSILNAARKQRGMSAGEYLTSLHRIFQEVNPAPSTFSSEVKVIDPKCTYGRRLGDEERVLPLVYPSTIRRRKTDGSP